MIRLLTSCTILVLLLAAGPARAQQGPETRVVTIVNADSVAGEVANGERLRRLFGNVHLRQDTTDLRAHRAVQYLDRDVIVFEGNVSIADPTDTLRAARVTYDSRSRVGRAQGNVRLSDAEAVLYSDSLIFFRAEKRAVFEAPVRLIEREGGGVLTSRRGTYFTDRKEALFQQDVRLEDSTSVLTSRLGRYGTEDKRADFSGDVRLSHQESTRLRADSLTHFRDTRISEARGNVAVLRFGGREADEAEPDTTARTILFGGFAHHDEDRRYSRVERGRQVDDPLVVRLSANGQGDPDTLLVRAHLFEALQPDSLDNGPLPPGQTLQRVFARGDVHLAGDRLAAVADSAVVDRIEYDAELDHPIEDDIRLFRNPLTWINSRGSSQFTQVSGDSIRVTARAEAVDSLRAMGSAFSVRPDSILDRNNQIRGRQMLGLFRDDSLRSIHVWTSAEALFFRADSEGQLEGGTIASGDSLSFSFRGDDIRRIDFSQDIEGSYYDASILPEPFRLEGPAFAPERRPTTAGLLAGRPPLIDPFELPPAQPGPVPDIVPEPPLDAVDPDEWPDHLEPIPLRPEERPTETSPEDPQDPPTDHAAPPSEAVRSGHEQNDPAP